MMQAVIDELDVVSQIEEFVGLHRLLERPIIIVAEENAGFGHDLGALYDGGKQFDLLAQMAYFLVGAPVLAAVMSHGGPVELFGAGVRLPAGASTIAASA